MSKKIDHILEVLKIVEHRYFQDKTNSIVDLRVDATTEIAERLKLWRTTVLDKYQRGLEPDVYGTEAFDSLMQAWLTNASSELQNVLLKHASDEEDRKNIAGFFGHDGPKNENLYQDMQRLTKLVESGVESEAEYDPEANDDERKTVAREIVQRQGQRKFREKLLDMYENKCCVTGTSVIEVLEAAHIHPYRGKISNHPTNGLLLRADIHTLFDYGLLTIDEDNHTILVSEEIKDLNYRKLHDRKIALPKNQDLWPSNLSLQQHRIASKIPQGR